MPSLVYDMFEELIYWYLVHIIQTIFDLSRFIYGTHLVILLEKIRLWREGGD